MRPSPFRRFVFSKRKPHHKRPKSDNRPHSYGDVRLHWPFFLKVQGGMCYLVARPRFPEDIPLGVVLPLFYYEGLSSGELREVCMGLKKPDGVVGRKAGPGRPVDPGSVAELPTLFAYLCDDAWEDGSERQRSTLIIFAEDDVFKCCLTDKDNDLTMWVASRKLGDLFGCLEARLCDPDADWRKRRPPQQISKKRG